MKTRKRKKPKKFKPAARQKNLPLPRLEEKARNYWNRNLRQQAERTYALILSIQPDHLEALFHLGILKMQSGRLDESLSHLLRARELAPFDDRILYYLGEVYGQSDLAEEAIGQYQACLRLHRNADQTSMDGRHAGLGIPTAKILARLSFMYFRTGRYDEAREYTEKTLLAEPQNPVAMYVQAKLHSHAREYQKAARILEEVPLQEGDTIMNASILNELGHVYDRLGLYAKAFGSITRSNRIIRGSAATRNIDPRVIPHRIHLIRQNLDILFQKDSPERSYSPAQGDRPAPVFLVGFPRSGTTLTEQLLLDEFHMAVSDEFPVIMDMINSLPALLSRQFAYPADLRTITMEEIHQLREHYWQQMSSKIPEAAANRDNFLDKLPLNIINLPFIQKIFPDSRLIVALRDPRDVCISNYFQMFKLNESMIHFLDFGETVSFYNLIMHLWLEFRPRLTIPFLESRYEELVNDKEASMAVLADFLGKRNLSITGDPSRAQTRERYISTPSFQDAKQPIYRRSLHRWLNYKDILREDLEKLDPVAGELGYPAVGSQRG